jgi:hypothetical protein
MPSSSLGEATTPPEPSSSSSVTDMTNCTCDANSSGYGGTHTPPHQIQPAPRDQNLITPHKPTLYERTAKYLSMHFSMSINRDCVIMKASQVVTIPLEIRNWLMTHFRQVKIVYSDVMFKV